MSHDAPMPPDARVAALGLPEGARLDRIEARYGDATAFVARIRAARTQTALMALLAPSPWETTDPVPGLATVLAVHAPVWPVTLVPLVLRSSDARQALIARSASLAGFRDALAAYARLMVVMINERRPVGDLTTAEDQHFEALTSVLLLPDLRDALPVTELLALVDAALNIHWRFPRGTATLAGRYLAELLVLVAANPAAGPDTLRAVLDRVVRLSEHGAARRSILAWVVRHPSADAQVIRQALDALPEAALVDIIDWATDTPALLRRASIRRTLGGIIGASAASLRFGAGSTRSVLERLQADARAALARDCTPAQFAPLIRALAAESPALAGAELSAHPELWATLTAPDVAPLLAAPMDTVRLVAARVLAHVTTPDEPPTAAPTAGSPAPRSR